MFTSVDDHVAIWHMLKQVRTALTALQPAV